MIRSRNFNQERECKIETNFVGSSLGSCLISMGNTKVLCTCSVENYVPPFLIGSNSGWITAEYSMLPGSTSKRKKRDIITRDSRSVEIQRLIGRSLRQAVYLNKIGERTITLDCDVIQADGGTRTASINGAYVALVIALDKLIKQGLIDENPLRYQVAAISAGIINKEIYIDLCYDEDINAQADINIVLNNECDIIEIQGTGERSPVKSIILNDIITKCKSSILRIMKVQRDALLSENVETLPKKNIIFATQNKHKAKELSLIFKDKYNLIDLITLGYTDEIEETGSSFSENSKIKAESICNTFNLQALADDSGICIDALEGRPGIRSARYGGYDLDSKQKNQLVLKEMKNKENRRAYFECCMTLASPKKLPISVSGKCEGTIMLEEHGTNGFGYDTIFCLADGRPLATISDSEKNLISHRGIAAKKIDEFISKE